MLVGISQHYVQQAPGAVAAARPNDKAGGCSTTQQVPISIKQKRYPKQHDNLWLEKVFLKVYIKSVFSHPSPVSCKIRPHWTEELR